MCILQTQSTGGAQSPLCMSAQISCQENSACGSIISESFDHASPRQASGVPQKPMEHKKNFSSVPFLLIKSQQQHLQCTTFHLMCPTATSKIPSHFLTQQNIITIAKEKLSKTYSPKMLNVTFKNFIVWYMAF